MIYLMERGSNLIREVCLLLLTGPSKPEGEKKERKLKILREQGLTILLVSQEVERSLELSQRAYVLENGQISLEGKSNELLNNDKVRASYLGM